MAESNAHDPDVTLTESDAAALAADIDVGARNPPHWQGGLIAAVALLWSLFQIYYASNFPYMLTGATGINFTLNSDMARAIHLAFAMFLAATAYPMFKTSPHDYIPWYDWLLA
ncbi:MAG: C4-dicarboxylate ABC transporter, partial [Candidatus Tectomicrobia bacterium]|nr:C4-dicarboxylate ABC transporter [Candidatus Tectomicrobia bacterium]